MMKRFFALILALSLSLSGCFMSANSSTTVELEDEPLTFVNETVYLLYKETVTYPDGTEYYREFDTQPNLPDTNFISNGTKSINGEEVGTCYREYDPLGNLIAEKDEAADIRYELTYNDQEQIVKKVTFVDEAESTTEEYTYTEGLLTETVITENGVQLKRFVTEYDHNGHRDVTTEYNGSGDIVQITRFERKDSKEIASDYTPEDILLGYRHIVYSYQDKIAKEECFSPDGELLKTSIWWYLGQGFSYLEKE